MVKLSDFCAAEVALKVNGSGVTAVRSGFRAIAKDEASGAKLSKYLSGQLPYYYRKIESIVSDFEAKHDALELLIDLMAAAPTTQKFRNSHGAEILAACYLEEKLKLRRLYSKLTLTTAEDTNAHKMDALFVNLNVSPYDYIFVEAKGSVLPTAATPVKHHRNGLLDRMIKSLDSFSSEEPRMEYVRIRENLETGFPDDVRANILSDLRMPGPDLKFIGISVTNAQTVNAEDDDFILSTHSETSFDYYALVVADLQTLTSESYGIWDKTTAAAKGS